MNTLIKTFGGFIGIIVTLLLVVMAITIPFMLAWNYVMPYLFGFKTLSILESFCLCIVTNVLFKAPPSNK